MIELTAVKHAMNFVPQRWLFIISGHNLSQATELVQHDYDYHFTRFARKGNKYALQYKRTPSLLLMALLLKPKSRKRHAVGDNDL